MFIVTAVRKNKLAKVFQLEIEAKYKHCENENKSSSNWCFFPENYSNNMIQVKLEPTTLDFSLIQRENFT